MRASRTTHEAVVVHQRSAVLFLDALEVADRFAVSAIPRPTVRGVKAERRDRAPRHELRYGRRGFGPRNASGRAKS